MMNRSNPEPSSVTKRYSTLLGVSIRRSLHGPSTSSAVPGCVAAYALGESESGFDLRLSVGEEPGVTLTGSPFNASG